MNNNSITVCIPSKLENHKYIIELIESLNKQTVQPEDLIIVASGRKIEDLHESSVEIKRQISTTFEVRFIFSEKKGLSLARNLGTKNCKSEIIIFGDDDDIWDPERIFYIKNAIIKNGTCLVRHLHSDLKNEEIIDCPRRYSLPPDLFLIGTGNLLGGGSNFAGSLSCFSTIQFNENLKYCEDWEFWIRALLSNTLIVSINKPLVIYRSHQNRMTNSFLKNYIFETTIRIIFIYKTILFSAGLILGFIKSTLRLLGLDLIKILFKKFMR